MILLRILQWALIRFYYEKPPLLVLLNSFQLNQINYFSDLLHTFSLSLLQIYLLSMSISFHYECILKLNFLV